VYFSILEEVTPMMDRSRPRSIPKKKDAAQLWEYALRALGRRGLSAGEMRQRLKEKAAEPGDVEPAMAKLKEYGYLDDARFAETYAGSRRANQSLGRIRVLQDLRSRRVGPETAAVAVAKIYAETDEVALVEEFIARKFRNRNMAEYLADPNHLSSAYRKLRYAGFSSSVSIRVLKRYTARAEEIEE
jgi:regulatory protein